MLKRLRKLKKQSQVIKKEASNVKEVVVAGAVGAIDKIKTQKMLKQAQPRGVCQYCQEMVRIWHEAWKICPDCQDFECEDKDLGGRYLHRGCMSQNCVNCPYGKPVKVQNSRADA